MGEHPRLSTFWFSDVEGSTKLLANVGDLAYRELLREHRTVVRAAFTAHGGEEVGTEGDSFFATFPSPPAAASAAEEVRAAFEGGPIRVRIGIHSGLALGEEGGYVGLDVHRAARIASIAHGGQVVLSDTARAHVTAEVIDLGEHRLKDLSAPQRLFQLGAGSFPPLRSLYRTNLPVPATPFLGRADALEAVAALLGREDVRLVTLTGPGGMGKTRLALQAAADAADRFPDGVWWIPLAPLQDHALVLSTIAQTLQIGGTGGAIAASLTERLAGRNVLVLIDNAEHLLPDIALAIAHLNSIDGPRLCVTSRERLALPAEHVFTVPALSERDAVGLFVARARQLDPGFAETRGLPALCRQLDNLPLAIELAAARSNLFSVDELGERLGDGLDLLKAGPASETRHRTLEAAIDWSYRLLRAEEQQVYRALALFRGGCTVAALEQIGGTDALTIGSLLDKSLVRRRDGDGGPRLFMLEMVRRHATQLLAGDPAREALAAASARYFTDHAERAFERVTSFAADTARWWGSVRDERDNVRAALAFHLAARDAESLARLCSSEWLLWYFVGDASEGAQWLQRALSLSPPRHLLSPLENAYSALLLVSGDTGTSQELAAAAVAHARELGDERAEAAALITLGNGQLSEAVWAEAATTARAAGADWWEACALTNLAEWALRRGDRDDAIRLCDEIGRLARGTANIILPLGLFRAEITWIEGDVESACEQLTGLLEQQRTTLFSIAYPEVLLAARILAGEGRLEDAAVLISAAEARQTDLGFSLPEEMTEPGETLIARLDRELGADGFAAAEARGRMLSVGETIARAIEMLGGRR